MRLLAVLLFALLAGCSSPAPEEPEPVFEAAPLEAIRGVVVDGAIIPLADVRVWSGDVETRTDSQGRFILPGFEGTHLVQADHEGYRAVEIQATAGPTIHQLQLLPEANTDPFVETMQWNGLLACSWTIGLAFYTGCGVGEYIDDHSRRFDMIGARPHFLQSELDWDATQIAGENLCMRHYASSGVGGDILGDACGPTPQVFALDAERIEEVGIGNTRGIERVVWADSWTAEAPTVGIALDQPFEVYTNLFYHFQPRPGWTFLADGPHPVPA
ncbi:MAG: carboxypeptidase-like regulatory domain-containing protein [Thermoplasmatota archaeon]